MSLGILTASLRTLKNIKTIPNDVVGYVASKIQDDDEDYSHIKKRKSRLQVRGKLHGYHISVQNFTIKKYYFLVKSKFNLHPEKQSAVLFRMCAHG